MEENSLVPGDRVFIRAKLREPRVYGQDVEYASPLFQSAEVEGSKIIVRSEPATAGLMSNDGKPLREFTICGADQKFVPADARIVDDTVIVSSPNVSQPIAVRYAWKNDPMVNLFGKNGLPVGPFRTDTFELPEQNP
ncbi:MAG: sialate O-acetylesterase [Verrucomicrobiales bacterium]